MDEFLTNIWSGILLLGVMGFVVYFMIRPSIDRKKLQSDRINKNDMDTLHKMAGNKERRKKIVNRVHSYQYENLIYEIYSPYAENKKTSNKIYGTFPRQSWAVTEYLEDEFIKSEISRIMAISKEEATAMFNSFLKSYLLIHKSYNAHKSLIGPTLSEDWDIISKNDMNLSRWMESHHNIETKESADKRREPYNLCRFYPFYEFVNEHGVFEVTASSLTSKDTFWIRFSDKTKIVFSLQRLNIKLETKYRYKREDEITSKLLDMHNIYVMIDDIHYELVLEHEINWLTQSLF